MGFIMSTNFKPRLAQHIFQFFACELATNFGTYCVTLFKAQRPSKHIKPNFLVVHAHNMHFDLIFGRIIKSIVLKICTVEVCAELTIQYLQQVEVEGRSYTGNIIIGSMQNIRIFYAISAKK